MWCLAFCLMTNTWAFQQRTIVLEFIHTLSFIMSNSKTCCLHSMRVGGLAFLKSSCIHDLLDQSLLCWDNVLVTSSLTNLIPRKSVNVPSQVNSKPNSGRSYTVPFCNPKIINIENNHDGFAVQLEWVCGTLEKLNWTPGNNFGIHFRCSFF